MSLSDTAVFVALHRAAGLSYGATRDAFLTFANLSPDPAVARVMGASQSCCATILRAELAAAGVDGRLVYHGAPHDVLREPYAKFPGQIFELLETLAQKYGAYLANPTDDDLQPGNAVLIESPDHVFLITGRTVADDGTIMLSTVEGGQPDPHNGNLDTAVLAKTRVVQHGGGRLVVGRMVRAVIAVDKLPSMPQSDTLPPADGAGA